MTSSLAKNTPVVLMILDGWGERPEKEHNGIELAHKPFFDQLKKNYPHTLIDASGPAVGLPKGIMGNSEVGHMNLGAGRIVYTGLSQIYKAIEDKSFFHNSAFLKAIGYVKKNHSTLHVMCLLSDGAVHSHQDHLYALIDMAKIHDVKKLALHCILDGRDTSPQDGLKYLEQLHEKITEAGIGFIASLSGRYFTMDRDQRWERVEQGFQAICGQSMLTTENVRQYVEQMYAQNITDEFLPPVCVLDAQKQKTSLSQKDAFIFMNFRADRARQISQALTQKNFESFDRHHQELPEVFVCATPYDPQITAEIAFEPQYPKKTLGEVLSWYHLRQLRLAETEKYAHVTFFFNGGSEQPFTNEDRLLVKSPRDVATYDLKPEMSALEIRRECLKDLQENKHDVIIMNFANTDMVGHTAKPDAIIKAVETVDACLAEIIPAVLEKNGTVIITADHGNAEQMVDPLGQPMTAHTTHLVPFFVVSDSFKNRSLKTGGRLCDVAPTLLDILGISQPSEMTGISLLD